MKRSAKVILFAVIAIVLLVIAFFSYVLIYSQTYTIPEQDMVIENNTGLVQAHGRSLYDADGNKLQLKGINAGQILLQEGWMSPFALEPLKNDDGSYVKDADGNLQYPEFSEEQFREGIKSNPNLSGYEFDDLMKIYRECVFTEEDFRIISEELKLNTVRLPFYYLDILNDDLTLKNEDQAFEYIDWFISEAAEYGLYVVLDLHGAPGSQNGYEHSGAAERSADLWDSEENVAATISIWDFISVHYTQSRPDLGKWVASYDILNEPTVEYKGVTTKKCWDVFDRIYDAIRENGDNHLISIEGCWNFSSLPDPDSYGWENVQYEYHWYNWWSDFLSYDLLYAYYDMSNIFRDYNVPVYIGEFTVFEDTEAWEKVLNLYDERNYSWTIWNYKTTVTGWWTSSWGVYTCQLNCDTATEETKCNVAMCTYDEFVAACEKMRTENCSTGTLYEVLLEYSETDGK